MSKNYYLRWLAIFLSTICLVKEHDAARILAYFPVPSISHQVVFRALTLELHRRGHELVVLTPDPAFPKGQAPPNFTEIDLHEESYGEWRRRFINNAEVQGIEQTKLLINVLTDIMDMQLSTDEVKKILNSERKFDLVLAEACMRPAGGLAYLFKAPLIQVSSFGPTIQNVIASGADSHVTYYPFPLATRLYNLSLWEKLQSIYEHLIYEKFFWTLSFKEDDILRKHFGPNAPSSYDVDNMIDLFILNMHSLWDNNRPVPPNVIYAGGLHQKQKKTLPQDLKDYLDGSSHGVIYMSFGTNVDPTLLPAERIKVFTNVFSKLPYDILWKWNGDNMTDKPDNVQISKWLPQSDLLRHPKVKLFITQAGLQSTDEAITAGVPLIAFPMLGDQWYNAEQYVHFKIGVQLDIKTITEEALTAAIKNVIQDVSYRKQIEKLRDVYNDNPQTSMERAVWWTEYVIRHKGAPHLRSAAANISWSEYLILDVVSLIIVICLALFGLVLYVCRILMSYMKPKSKLKKK